MTKAQQFLEGITNGGEFFMEAMARTVEYLATFATIYLILEVGIVSLQAFPIPHNIALGIILSSPELVMIGAYGMAVREIKAGNKAGWALIVSVGVLLLLTFLTVFDLMVWHFDANGVNVLMAFRFIASIMYAFTRGVVTRKHQPDQVTPPALPTIDIEELVSKTIAEATTKLVSSQTQMIADLSSRQEQAANLQRIEQQRLLTTIQEVKDTQQTLQIAAPGEQKEEIVNTVLNRLQTLFVEQQEAQQTRQIAAPKNTVQDNRLTHAHASIRQQTGQTEIVKRPKRIDPEEVDAVVHPLLDKDRSLTHRKIAALPGVSYTETVVYASVKRWREIQPVVSGDLPEGEEGEVS